MKPRETAPSDLHAMAFGVAQIQTHTACNSSCIMCPHHDIWGAAKPGKMEWPLFEKVVEDLAGYPSLDHISLMLQNEPLLDRELGRRIQHIKEYHPAVGVGISTNGALLDETMLGELVNAGLDTLVFSLNALTEETFLRVQPGLDFNRVMQNLRHLAKTRPPSLSVFVKALVMKENLFEMVVPARTSDLPEFLERNKIPFGIDPISNRAGSLINYREQLVLEERQSSRDKFFCHDPFATVNILFNGDVITCCADWRGESVVGNLAENSLREIWNGDQARSVREMIAKGRYLEMKPCRECSQAQNIMENRKRHNL